MMLDAFSSDAITRMELSVLQSTLDTRVAPSTRIGSVQGLARS
jgi:hypothetical protein